MKWEKIEKLELIHSPLQLQIRFLHRHNWPTLPRYLISRPLSAVIREEARSRFPKQLFLNTVRTQIISYGENSWMVANAWIYRKSLNTIYFDLYAARFAYLTSWRRTSSIFVYQQRKEWTWCLPGETFTQLCNAYIFRSGAILKQGWWWNI